MGEHHLDALGDLEDEDLIINLRTEEIKLEIFPHFVVPFALLDRINQLAHEQAPTAFGDLDDVLDEIVEAPTLYM